MLAQQFAGLSYLALTAELQNLVMLLIGALHAVGEVELQAGVPFPVFFEIADNPLEPRLVGAGVKDGMKLPVQSPPRRNVVVPPQFTYIFAQHSCGFRKVVFCKAWNRKFQNLGLEQGANRKELFDIIGGQGGYNCAPVRNNGNQTFCVQLPQGFANRNSADLVLSRDCVLPELGALRELTPNNLVAQFIGNRRSERLSRDG